METITGGSLLLQFIVIVALTGINAFFSSAEMAIVSINKNKLKILVEEGNRKAIMLENLMKEPSKFLSTIQDFLLRLLPQQGFHSICQYI